MKKCVRVEKHGYSGGGGVEMVGNFLVNITFASNSNCQEV